MTAIPPRRLPVVDRCTHGRRPGHRAVVGAAAQADTRRRRHWATVLAAAWLAGCGGGGRDEAGVATPTTASSVAAAGAAAAPPGADAQAAAERKRALAALPTQPIPADAPGKGMWGPLYDWPLVAVHAVLLPDGRVMSYGSRADGTQSGKFEVDVWDNVGTPATGHTQFVNGGTDLFCSSQLLLAPTSATSAPAVFVAGGDIWSGTGTLNSGNADSNVISPSAGSVTRGASMARARWYSSSTTLLDGSVYVQGGTGGTDRPEVRTAAGSLRLLAGADTGGLAYMYPRNFVQPDGRLFGIDANGAMYVVDTAGNGSLTARGSFAGQYASADASAAMFRPGRILQFGGNSNGAIVIDVAAGGVPTVTPTQSMSAQRRLASATLLADGRVLATGGSRLWNDPATAVLPVEVWNPQTGQWTVGPTAARPRLYHSNALLLPDATVLVTGGGAALRDAISAMERNAQIYYPSYLFTAAGQWAPRPSITTAPTWVDIGSTFTVQTAGTATIGRVALVKTGSATHNWNMEQRFQDLTFTAAGGGALKVQAPTRAGEAPPGFYLLFVFNTAGVPSVAATLRIGVAADPNPAVVPFLANPGARSTTAGTTVRLALTASDPNGDALRFGATGLPAGLAIDAASGVISGTPTTAATNNVVVTASDGVNTASASFTWTVTAPLPLVLTAAPVPTASLSGATATFAATATGSGVEYRWNFGDGTPDSAWSATGTAAHVYAAPGTYVVTMSVRSAGGELLSRTLLQTVYLPPTTAAARASSALLVETPAGGGNARLWVVNPDHDSVTAFDAVTRARLGEVAVGAAPRTIARAADGRLWVANQRGASLSVVDPATRSVVRTVALPRGSQPWGVVTSPVGNTAYVTLDAAGRLLKFDTATYAQTASLATGPNVRQLSVSGDGALVLVSRFITPPLPGEGTPSVTTSGAGVGAQVLQVAASTLALTRTITLAHSDRPDAQNQGRGIPNYLGAPAISPDGSQAWVPGKQDNIVRGALRDGQPLDFQNTVRAVSSRIALTGSAAYTETPSLRADHDNAGLAAAAVYDVRGSVLFVALETSREIAVVDAFAGTERMRFNVGRAPQALALSADGRTLYVQNFMDRTVGVHDLAPLLDQGVLSVPLTATLSAVASERLNPAVLRGKQLFYDARDTRLARDGYLSCAACHADGGHDGRTWDFTHTGEGLRNTLNLRGRAGGQGRLHWSANFDEVQDFEGQIRTLAGGTGLMSDADFNAGTRRQPLGDRKAGLSADLDALAAYVSSLATTDPSPARNADGTPTTDAVAGRAVFAARCAGCHAGSTFTNSDDRVLHDIGTVKAASGRRLNAALDGIDTPTLRDAWATAPYLHDGSAATLEQAIQAHGGIALSAADLASVVAYTRQIGGDESAAPASTANLVVTALADLADRIGALYEVRVNSAVVAKGRLDAPGWVRLFIDVAALVKDAVIDLVFKNDGGNAAEDRNLALQSVLVNGSTTVAATAAGNVIDGGSGAQAFDNLDTVAASATGGWIPWNGSLRMKVPTLPGGPVATDTVTVRASATLAGGVGAQIELRLNGALVATRTVTSTTVTDWVVATPPVAIGDRLDVVFTNDAAIGTEDRNLYVESVTARGVRLMANGAGVVIDRGSDAAAFDGLDLVDASVTGGWVPWNAALRLTAR